MRLSRFNEAGIRAFREIIDKCRQGEVLKTPLSILDVPELINESLTAEIPAQTFETRLEAATAISIVLDKASIPDDMQDSGLWAWLSAAYFDTICPPDSNGFRKAGADYRYIPSDSYKDFYRHLLRGPLRIHRLFKHSLDSAMIILCQMPASPGDFVEQLAARQERISSQGVIGAATAMYYDVASGKPKRGAAPNSRKPGTLRRYLDVLDQIELNYDLQSIGQRQLLDLLPREFLPWRNQ